MKLHLSHFPAMLLRGTISTLRLTTTTNKYSISDLNLDHLNKVFVAVGFHRATGHGVFNAIIWDVVVDPSFQGIGNIALYSEPRVLGFYRPLGFVADPDGLFQKAQEAEMIKKDYFFLYIED